MTVADTAPSNRYVDIEHYIKKLTMNLLNNKQCMVMAGL